jgi:radical SAM modification target selenobiotic family peptide
VNEGIFLSLTEHANSTEKGGEYGMDKKDFKKILAGLSITGLLAGGGLTVGCTQQPQEPPATTQETPAPAEQIPAPSS